jgi:pentatricopeptide repeat protein
LIDHLCKENNVDKAQELVVEALNGRGVSPDAATFSALVDGLCKEGKMEEAHKLWESIAKKDKLGGKNGMRSKGRDFVMRTKS